MRYKIKVYLARKFRKNSTISEKIMWNNLKDRKLLNLKFRRQFIIFNYILDFYCHELKLAIEIDGGIHNQQVYKDNIRQKIIESKNVIFFRITNEDVENNIKKVLKKLRIFINDISPSPRSGEGDKGGEE